MRAYPTPSSPPTCGTVPRGDSDEPKDFGDFSDFGDFGDSDATFAIAAGAATCVRRW
jgi:hypothetical protein